MTLPTLLWLTPLVLLAAAATPRVVPITSEPHHRFKFENAFVRIFDVEVRPGDATLWHSHDHDYVFVMIGPSHVISDQPDGRSSDLRLENGEARYTPAGLVHQARNVGDTPFRNITVEILAPGSGEGEPPPTPSAGNAVLLENDRIRIERQVLAPGESTGMHAHSRRSVGICIDGARVAYTDADGKTETADLAPGEFNWHGEPRRHTLRNVGTTTFTAVSIELK